MSFNFRHTNRPVSVSAATFRRLAIRYKSSRNNVMQQALIVGIEACNQYIRESQSISTALIFACLKLNGLLRTT